MSESEDHSSATMVGKMSRTELGDVLVSALQKMPGRPRTEQVEAPPTLKCGAAGRPLVAEGGWGADLLRTSRWAARGGRLLKWSIMDRERERERESLGQYSNKRWKQRRLLTVAGRVASGRSWRRRCRSGARICG